MNTTEFETLGYCALVLETHFKNTDFVSNVDLGNYSTFRSRKNCSEKFTRPTNLIKQTTAFFICRPTFALTTRPNKCSESAVLEAYQWRRHMAYVSGRFSKAPPSVLKFWLSRTTPTTSPRNPCLLGGL